MLGFCGRNAGIVIAAVVAVLWWFAPTVETALFVANQQFLLLVASVLPLAAGKFLGGLVELVQSLQTALSAPKLLMSQGYADQFVATVAVVANTLLVLAEVKAIRWTAKLAGFCWHCVSWPFRRRTSAKVVPLRRVA